MNTQIDFTAEELATNPDFADISKSNQQVTQLDADWQALQSRTFANTDEELQVLCEFMLRAENTRVEAVRVRVHCEKKTRKMLREWRKQRLSA